MKLQYIIDTVLSTELKALPFVDRYGSVVQTLTQQIDDGEGTSPTTKSYPVSCDVQDIDCNNTGFYQNLVPDDSKDSVVYWEIVTPMYNAGPTKIKDFHTRKFKGVARLVVWMNIAKLGGADTKSPFFAIAPIEKVLTKKVKLQGGEYDGSHLWIQTKGMVMNDTKSVFGKYTYPKLNAYSLYPYGFFAIDVNFEIDLCLAKGGTFPINPPIDCPNDTGVTACEKLLASLTEEERNECILPTYDFSDTTVQVNVTGQQQTDLTDWLCTTPSIDQYSMSYNGVNQFLQVVSYPEFNFGNTDPFTLEIWIKPVSYASTRTILEKRVLFGNFTGIGLFHTSGVLRFLMRGTGTDFIEVKTVETQTDNVWSHVLIKVDGSSTAAGVEIWVNNVQQTPDVMSDNLTTSTANTEPLKIGGTSAGYLNGNIGYCRFWDTFLSVSNGTAQYNGGKMLDVPALPLNNVFSNRSGVGAVKSTTWVFPDQAEVAIDPAVFSNNMVFSNITTDVPT